ncbi:Hsp70 family protein [Streptomyces sp. NPDC056948]|uniref:Hsp70 family protein n=1 Tax=Streptomyces sp. NPDC056948 TaxID=3345975 RepID=UPI00364559A4
MEEPVLCVDMGATATRAALLIGTRIRMLRDPVGSTADWPTAVFADGAGLLVGRAAVRRGRERPEALRGELPGDLGRRARVRAGERSWLPDELVGALLRVLRDQAEAIADRPVTTALLTVPAGIGAVDPRRAGMLSAARRAGLTTVELLAEPVAAVLALGAGGGVRDGDLVLVHDLGGSTFTAALVRMHGPDRADHDVLGHLTLDGCGMRDIEGAVSATLRADGAPGFAGPPADEAWTHPVNSDADGGQAYGDRLLNAAGAARFAEIATPFLDRAVACCEEVMATARVERERVTSVLPVGGGGDSPVVLGHLTHRLGVPVRAVERPSHAVLRGACVRAVYSARRTARPRRPAAGAVPLTWDLPGGRGVLVERRIEAGTAFAEGDLLARVRVPDGSLHQLVADANGRITAWHAAVDDEVFTGDWLVTVSADRSAAGAGMPAPTGRALWRTHADAVTAVAFSPDGRFLGTGGADRSVSVWDLGTGGERASAELDDDVTAVAFSPTQPLAAARDLAGGLVVLDHERETPVFEGESLSEGGDLVFTDDGGLLVAVEPDDIDFDAMWFTDTWEEAEPEEFDSLPDGVPPVLALLDDEIATLSSPSFWRKFEEFDDQDDFAKLADAYDDLFGERARLSVVATPAALFVAGHRPDSVLKIPARGVTSFTCSSATGLLATCTPAEGVAMWSLEDGRLLRTLPVEDDALCLAFAPDGSRLAAGLTDGTTVIWTLTRTAAPPVADSVFRSDERQETAP